MHASANQAILSARTTAKPAVFMQTPNITMAIPLAVQKARS